MCSPINTLLSRLLPRSNRRRGLSVFSPRRRPQRSGYFGSSQLTLVAPEGLEQRQLMAVTAVSSGNAGNGTGLLTISLNESSDQVFL